MKLVFTWEDRFGDQNKYETVSDVVPTTGSCVMISTPMWAVNLISGQPEWTFQHDEDNHILIQCVKDES